MKRAVLPGSGHHLALKYNAEQASNALSKYICEHFGEVGKSDSLLQLPHVRAEVVVPEEEDTCLLQEAL